MFDEYSLLADFHITDRICDGQDLDDVLHRFDYNDDVYVTAIKINHVKMGIEDRDNG